MNRDVEEKIKEINTEDLIWVIYIGIIIMSWYSNSFERKYFLFNDKVCKEKYRNINILIFSVLAVIYCYFLKNSVRDLKNLKPTDSEKKKKLVISSFVASLFITISGFLFLYVALMDDNIDVEIAFN